MLDARIACLVVGDVWHEVKRSTMVQHFNMIIRALQALCGLAVPCKGGLSAPGKAITRQVVLVPLCIPARIFLDAYPDRVGIIKAICKLLTPCRKCLIWVVRLWG